MSRLLLALCLVCGVTCGINCRAQADYQALAQKATDAERRGDFATAIAAFQQLIQMGADGPELRSNLGIAYYQSGAWDSALREFQFVLAKDRSSVPGNLFTGLSLLKLERPKSALPYLETAHKAQPDALPPVLALAQTEIACDNILRAQALYQEATRLDPQNAEAWYGLGIADRALAEPEVGRSIKARISGPVPQATTAKARELMNASQQAFARALQLDPQSLQAHMVMGESFRIAERYEDAIREYTTATEQAPKLAAAWAGLAAAYSAATNDEEALKAARRAEELDPNDAQSEAIIAGTLLRQGDYASAEPHARKALEIQPTLASAHLVMAKIYLSRQERLKALPELKTAAKDDTDGNVYYLLATTLRELGKPDEAATALQKYKALHSAHVAAMK